LPFGFGGGLSLPPPDGLPVVLGFPPLPFAILLLSMIIVLTPRFLFITNISFLRRQENDFQSDLNLF
jgi:hypothetical protein